MDNGLKGIKMEKDIYHHKNIILPECGKMEILSMLLLNDFS